MDARAKRAVSNEQAELLRQIPSVDELLLQPRLAALSNRVDRNVVVEVARAVLADLRARIAGDSNWSTVALNPGSVEELITGAESAIVVNNCAAAILVVLSALARGGEVIVSRGELIEIGDGFRIPEIMEQSGALLREV